MARLCDYKDAAFYYFSYRQPGGICDGGVVARVAKVVEARKEGKRESGGRGRGREDNENNGHDGEKAEEGEEGEGLTAINFAKIGAYPVVGRQSNPGSARATPFA